MKKIWMVIFLTLIWCGFSNNFKLPNLLLGLIVSIICCHLPPNKEKPYHIRVWALFCLLLFIAQELLISSLQVALEVIKPQHISKPKILKIDLQCHHDAERTLFTTLISLTPGTLVVDISDDKTYLLVHVMFAENPAQAEQFIKEKLEPKVLKVFRYANS